MHIKSITLQGFKTYNEATTITFSEGFGHNGSGKSNILLGFSFALGEIGNSAAERRLLLHEGVHGRVTSGFVELILDNSSRRLCMYDADSVVIRRSFSSETDEITVQGNIVGRSRNSSSSSSSSSRSSKSSFIIHQGRIQEVAVLSAAGRLSLLSAGCCSFIEEKTKETDLLLQKAYWVEAAETLKQAKERQEQHRAAIRRLAADAAAAEANRDEAAAQLANLSLEHSSQLERKKQMESLTNELQCEESRLRLESNLLAGEAEAQQQKRETMKELLLEKKKEMQHIQEELEKKLRPQHVAAAAAYSAAQQQHTQLQQQLQQLQQRHSFSGVSAAARQAAIRERLRDIEQQQKTEAAHDKQNKRKIQELTAEAKEAEKKVAAAAAAAAAAKATMDEATRDIAKLKAPLEEVVEQLRQQQAVLSGLLQQRNAAEAEVEPEYYSAVEAVGGFALFQFVVEDAAKALEAVARLKQQQQQQQQKQQQQSGLLLQRRCCVSIVPLKEVVQQQQQQQRHRSLWQQQMQQKAQQLLDEGVAMPLTECIRVLPEAAGIHTAAIEVYIQSIFRLTLLVPSLDSPQVQQLNASGYNCVDLSGLRNAQKKEEQLTAAHQQQQQTLTTLQQQHRELLLQEQQLIEKRLDSHHKAQAALEQQQQHKLLRHEALQAEQAPLTATEQELLQQLPQQLQQQQQLLQQLLQRVEETAAAVSEAEETLEVSLRRGVDRLEREAREEEGEGLGFRVYARVDAEAAALLKTRQQQEDAAAELETTIRALEGKLAAARERQAAAEASLQAAAAQLEQQNVLLQQSQLEETAAAAFCSLLTSIERLSQSSQPSQDSSSNNGVLGAAADDFKALKNREKLQDESLLLLQQQLQQLQQRRQQLLQQQLRRIDAHFSALFAQLVPGGSARLELAEDIGDDSAAESGMTKGVEMQLNFSAAAENRETLNMQRLSGGQKTVAAAALLLAQQLASSSSSSSSSGSGEGLLLLDEPDAALDSQYAQRLAATLQNAAANLKCQVIITTLRKELLSCGDKFWLVQQIQRASKPREITKEEAAELLLEMPQQQQQQQQQQLLLPQRALPEAVPSMG
ncbi:structural maintenance of chromosome domain-containing protein, putative [Eimeria acervulina]|uniref:Structural maintenance of chromosome domain-containing protein, putative n=1 Tax=Eimeria acervulina TaxID=5801 RepID=U6GK82_EIMAC|nr:structural maintenance of chromosome domain-containing protein, putative [Eimeria acervulina]CDI80560.1 structural maintenance of chromosome domain-containing protein, putative [Eimeria acervulina]